MKRMLPLFLLCLFSSAASAQTDIAAAERMERLERDIQLLQKQVARGETPAAPINDESIAAAGGPAQLEVRLSKMEEDMRALRGKVEEVEFGNRKLSEDFTKFQKDTEFRFGELTHTPANAAAPAPVEAGKKPERKPLNGNPDPASTTPPAPGDTTGGDGILRKPEDKPASEFNTPRDHYNYAFRLLNQTKYEEAAHAFSDFTKKYPKDPLIGNAYYWQGETYYIRRDYVAAADNFRQGFEALPSGPKAADNLLKLAMSLDALERDKEACVVLGQVVTKFKKSSISITDKAQQEQKRIGCQ